MPVALLTGSAGLVGRATSAALSAAGWQVRPFDLTDGQDLRDETAVHEAAAGCDAIVHGGAIAHDRLGTPADIMATNVLGTWHILLGAEVHNVARVVYISSAQVFGFAEGEGEPERLPIDDTHPLRAARPYGLSQRLAEEMCDAWTARTGIPTVVLRPVMIVDDDQLAHLGQADVEWGAFVHVNDVASAIELALRVPTSGHVRLTVCGPGPFDTAAAATALGWAPTVGWPASPPGGPVTPG